MNFSSLTRWLFPVILFGISLGCKPSNHSHSDAVALDLLQGPDTVSLFGDGLISTHLNERDLAISKDGQWIIYTLENYDQSIRALVGLQQTADGWTAPKVLSFSGVHNDIEPFFAPDGNHLYFASDRPLKENSSRTDYNLWRVPISDSGFGEPEPLSSKINSIQNEFYPCITESGNLYFTASYAHGFGRDDIFVAVNNNGQFAPPIPLDSTINSRAYEFNAFVSPDENWMIFTSYGRFNEFGGGDLFISRKTADGLWGEAENLGEEINSDALDYCPFVDLQNGILYFTSKRAGKAEKRLQEVSELEVQAGQTLNGLGNLYRIKAEKAGI